jgi:hypothetical protein
MALVLQDRVSVNSTGSGTGNLALAGAYPGYRTFASCIPDDSLVYYTIANQSVGYDTEWEVGYGTYDLTTDTLLRNTGNPATSGIYSSSNANAYVNFTAGANGLQVFITYPSEQAIFQETNGDVLIPNGILTVLGANATNPTFTSTLAEFVSNEPTFSQLFVQNQSNDANASADIAAYNNLGDGTSYFIDMGIDSSTFSSGSYPIFQANDGYLYTGGNIAGTGAAGDISRLIIGTSTANSNVVVFAGGVDTNNTALTISGANQNATFANSVTVTANASANNVNITNFAYSGANLSNAANSTVLVTQAYVDGAISTGFVVHTPVRLVAASFTGAGSTYNNGTAGVGATVTNNTNGALSIDGVTPTVGNRVLLINMSTAAYNGCYTVTVVGNVSTPWQLTRATDFDTAAPGEIANNAYFFVTSGTSYAGFSYVLSQLAAITVGTTALPFAEFAQALVYTGTAPINVAGQTISLTGVVPVANGGTNLTTYVAGDLIYANAANTLASQAIGSTNAVLISNGTVPTWATVALGSANAVSGTLGATNGGTAQSTYTLGDTLYSSATNTLAKLAGQTTTTQKFLSQTGTGAASAAPVWDTIPAASITGLGTMSTQNANAVTITGGSLDNVVIGGSTANAGTFTNVNATTVTATTGSFTNVSGNGSALTAINASNISSGTIANARTTGNTSNSASTIVLRDATGNFGANTISAAFSGDGSAISAINASNLSSGTVANARTTAATANGASTIVLRDGSGGFGAGDITAVSISGNGVALTAINASNIASGTIANARTTAASANGASTIVLRGSSGEFAAGVITADGSGLSAINASNISSGTVATARLATGTANSSTYLRGDSTWAAVTSGITITNDTTTNASYYVTLTTATSGTITTANTSSTKLFFNPSTGTLTSTVHTSNSDERLKENWEDVAPDFVEKLAKVKHGVFSRKDSGNREPGVGAQSFIPVLPEAVVEGADGYLSVNYGGAALVSAIELAKVIEELKIEIKELKAQVAELKAR